MRMTGGDVLAEMIVRQGADLAFGMGGFQLLPYYEGIRTRGLRHVLINDERAGAFAADAAARVTNRPGVVDATLGPGATNLATALAESQNAGVPVIAITGDAHRDFAHRNMTQETRQVEVLRPVVKELIRVEQVERIPEFVRRAYSVATSGRPGPVVIDVPEDVAHGNADFDEAMLAIDQRTMRSPSLRCRPCGKDVDAAAELIDKSLRPVILAGGGIHLSEAYTALLTLARRIDAPIAHTLSGKGAVSCIDPLSIGLFGRYSRIANEAIEASDCVIAVGCKLGEIATIRYTLPSPSIPLIHLDSEPTELGRWRTPTVALWADAKLGLEDLSAAVERTARTDYMSALTAAHDRWRTTAQPRYDSSEAPINVARIIGELNRWWPADGVVVVDGGFAAHWGGLLLDTKTAGRHFVAGRGMASIGYGLPGTLGASLALPGRAVIGLTGDGGFNMAVGELETARRAGLGFTLIVLNNAASGYIKALQHAFYGTGRYQSSDLSEIDYASVARAYGCEALRVESAQQLGPAIKRAAEPRSVPLVIDVVVTRDPAQMLPGIDSRTLKIKPGDRPV